MSAATRCDGPDCSAIEADRDSLSDWITVQQGGRVSDYCTTICAISGVEARQQEIREAYAEAMDADEDGQR